jgi:NDP-sugar pyrophosphorylase family protein
MDFRPDHFFDFNETDHSSLFDGIVEAWEALHGIKDYVTSKVREVPESQRFHGRLHPEAEIGPEVFIGPGTVVEAHAVIKGPAWIGAGNTIRSGAYLRENLIIGDNCTLGNSSEFKNCLLFNRCEVPHFNYVGDSILGFKAHLGAGVICSNVRLDRDRVRIRSGEGETIDTGLRKFGAIVGDRTEVGCHTVLSPGSILGKNCIIYPLTSWTGILDHNQIVKNQSSLEIVSKVDNF